MTASVEHRPKSPAPARHHRPAVTLLLAFSGWLALAATVISFTPLRTLAVFGFVLSCPGLAAVRLLPTKDRTEQLVVVVATSTAIAVVGSQLVYFAGIGSARTGLAVMAAATTLIAVAPDLRWRLRLDGRHRAHPSTDGDIDQPAS